MERAKQVMTNQTVNCSIFVNIPYLLLQLQQDQLLPEPNKFGVIGLWTYFLRRDDCENDEKPDIGEQREEDSDQEHGDVLDPPDLARRDADDGDGSDHHVVEHPGAHDQVGAEGVIVEAIGDNSNNGEDDLRSRPGALNFEVKGCINQVTNKPRHTEGHEEEVGQGAIPDGDLNLIKATVIICHKHLFQYVM